MSLRTRSLDGTILYQNVPTWRPERPRLYQSVPYYPGQNVLVYTRLYRNSPDYTRLQQIDVWSDPDCIRMYQNAPDWCLERPGLYQIVPECTKRYQNVPDCTRLYQNVPYCTRLYQIETNCTRLVSRVTQIVPERTTLCQIGVWSVPDCTKVYQMVRDCTRLY